MQSVQDFLKAKIDTEYYNLIVKGLHERERLNLSLADAEQLETLSTKNEQAYEFFNKNFDFNRSKQHDTTFQFVSEKQAINNM